MKPLEDSTNHLKKLKAHRSKILFFNHSNHSFNTIEVYWTKGYLISIGMIMKNTLLVRMNGRNQ